MKPVPPKQPVFQKRTGRSRTCFSPRQAAVAGRARQHGSRSRTHRRMSGMPAGFRFISREERPVQRRISRRGSADRAPSRNPEQRQPADARAGILCVCAIIFTYLYYTRFRFVRQGRIRKFCIKSVSVSEYHLTFFAIRAIIKMYIYAEFNLPQTADSGTDTARFRSGKPAIRIK